MANEEHQDNNWLSMVEGGPLHRPIIKTVHLSKITSLKEVGNIVKMKD